MTLINGVAVTSAREVPWQDNDDPAAKRVFASRVHVLFANGGEAWGVTVPLDPMGVCIGALVWERTTKRFVVVPLTSPP